MNKRIEKKDIDFIPVSEYPFKKPTAEIEIVYHDKWDLIKFMNQIKCYNKNAG